MSYGDESELHTSSNKSQYNENWLDTMHAMLKQKEENNNNNNSARCVSQLYTGEQIRMNKFKV